MKFPKINIFDKKAAEFLLAAWDVAMDNRVVALAALAFIQHPWRFCCEPFRDKSHQLFGILDRWKRYCRRTRENPCRLFDEPTCSRSVLRWFEGFQALAATGGVLVMEIMVEGGTYFLP